MKTGWKQPLRKREIKMSRIQQTFTRRTEDDGDIIEGEYTVTRADPQTKHQDYIEHKRD